MADVPKDMKFLLFGKGAKYHARTAMVLDFLGMFCFVVGIVGDAINRTLGLEPTSWFLMAVGLFVWGFWAWVCAYLAAKEG